MRNFVSLREVREQAPSIWKYLTEHECFIKQNKNSIYKGKMTDGKFLKYVSQDNAHILTLECYVNPDSTILLTIDKNPYIEKVKSLGSLENILSTPSLYCEAVNYIMNIPMVKGDTWQEKIKYVLEEDQGMDDAAEQEDDSNSDDSSSDALGQEGAKDDAKAKERADVQFKIFTAPDKQVTDLKEGEKYLKIEYVYRNKKDGIEIDFLIGKKKEDGNWQLYIGKPGSASYDDDPYKNLKTKDLSKAINTAVDEALDLIDEVKKDKDNWVQFYIHR